MQKPSGEFFSTLGYYVYWYADGDDPYYIGKGIGDRCWAHVVDKGFDPEHIHIVGQNLSEEQALALESYLIFKHNPKRNKVLGHHTEKFVMAKLSEVHTEYTNAKYDNFEVLPTWYTENYSYFKGKIRALNLSDTSTFVMSSANQQMYMMWYWYPLGEEPIKVTFEVNLPVGDNMNAVKERLCLWLKKEGFKNISDDGKAQKLAVYVNSIEEVLNLWNNFWS